MAWVILFVAGLLEVAWSLGLKATHGFTRLVPSVLTLLAIVGSMLLLGKALRTLPVGTGYAVWVGIGVVGSSIGGALLYGEGMPLRRLFFLVLLMVSIAGLKLTTPSAG